MGILNGEFKDVQDPFIDGHFSLNRLHAEFLGIWPNQKKSTKIFLTILYCTIMISIAIPEFVRLCEVWPELDSTVATIPPLFVISVCGIKYFTISLNATAFNNIFDRIKDDWNIYGKSFTRETIYTYGFRGYACTVFYTIFFYVAVTMFIMIPVMPVILDNIKPLNETRDRQPLFDTDYGVDPDDYFIAVVLHAYVTSLLAVQCIITVDCLALVLVEHCCSLFRIVEVILNKLNDEKHHDIEDFQYTTICQAISVHKHAIEFANTINSIFNNMYAAVIVANTLSISLTGVETVVKLGNKQYDQVLRFGIFTLGQMLHLFFNSIGGQELSNHSEETFNIIYNSNWSVLSPRCRRLITIMMMKSMKPCTITAGGYYTMNMDSFGKVMQTSMSYLTVLSSAR